MVVPAVLRPKRRDMRDMHVREIKSETDSEVSGWWSLVGPSNGVGEDIVEMGGGRDGEGVSMNAVLNRAN